MSHIISSASLSAVSAEDLCDQIKKVCRGGYEGPAIDHQPKMGRYALIFGPPGKCTDSLALIKQLPDDLVIAGSSMELSSNRDDPKIRDKWSAVVVQSAYISPAATFIKNEELATTSAEPTRSAGDLLTNFVQRLPNESRSYFDDGNTEHRRMECLGTRFGQRV